MPTPNCPPDDALAAFGSGRLPPATSDTLRAHLETCRGCAERLTALSGSGTVLPGQWPSGQSAHRPVPVPVPTGEVPVELAGLTQYENIRELGRGGMGVVYLAHNRLMNRPEVLKVVSRQHLHLPGTKERFLREVQSAARLQHPNVVAAYSVTEVGDGLVFAMEYVPGDDLLKVIRTGGPLPVPQACHYAAQVALSLHHAAEKGMVHRDIKPANLILTRDGKKAVVKVLDFGLAKVTSERAGDTGLTGHGQMMGTPDYMAPEQARDAARADIRADIYSLGCTLYHLIAGVTPFRDSSLTNVLLKHQSEAATPLNHLRPDVPPGVVAVVARMMAKEPGQRYQTPGEVAAALKPFFTKRPAGASSSATALPVAVAIPVASLPHANPWEGVATEAKAKTVRPAPAVEDDESDEDNRPRRTTAKVARPAWLWPAVGGGVLVGLMLLGLLAALAAGVFVQTKEGVIELTDLPPDADVFVDGQKTTVTWDGGKQKAEVGVKPGTHKVEVKRGDVTVSGEMVQVESGGKKVLTAKVKPIEVAKANKPPTGGDEGKPTPKPDVPAPPPTPPTEPVKTKADFTPLFNGEDLSGWKTHKDQPGGWRVENGVLIGSGPRANGITSYLYTERDDFTDFHLKAECRINDGGNSGILGRTSFGPTFPVGKPQFADGYEAQIFSPSKRDDGPKTGSLYVGSGRALVSLKESPVKAGEWFTLELIAQGNRITVKVDGKVTIDHTDDTRQFTKGRIALQQHDTATVCEFRKIEVKELAGKVVAAPPDPAKADPSPKEATLADAELQKDYRELADHLAQFKPSADFIKSRAATRFGAWRAAADSGSPDAMFLVARCLAVGVGVAEDKKEAFEWYLKAAGRDHAPSVYNLGNCYEYSFGVGKNMDKAIECYEKAAKLDYAPAMASLGRWCDSRAEGEKQAAKKLEWHKLAFKWYEDGAKLGDPQAMYNLGVCYSNGSGVSPNEKEAFGWYAKSAGRGNASAMYNLGGCYETAKGTPKNLAEAHNWYEKAAGLGHTDAKKKLAQLDKR